MAGQAVGDPLLTKRKNRRPIGFLDERYICLACAEEIDEIARPYLQLTELVEGDDAGVPYECGRCRKPLVPADDTNQIEA